MKFQTSIKKIRRIVKKIGERYRPEKVILFGSYAYGHPTDESDVDLLIIKRTSKKWVKRFVEVKRIAYKHRQSLWVSPLVYTPEEVESRLAIGDDFIKDILKKGIVLYD